MIWRVAVVSLALAAPAVAETPVEDIMAALRDQVAQCWAVDPADTVATTVVFGLDSSGRVVGDIVHVAPDGSDQAGRTAFAAARRAILRCQSADGFDLPPEHYGVWRNVELTFDPSAVDD